MLLGQKHWKFDIEIVEHTCGDTEFSKPCRPIILDWFVAQTNQHWYIVRNQRKHCTGEPRVQRAKPLIVHHRQHLCVDATLSHRVTTIVSSRHPLFLSDCVADAVGRRVLLLSKLERSIHSLLWSYTYETETIPFNVNILLLLLLLLAFTTTT